jgi:hypothetical protein
MKRTPLENYTCTEYRQEMILLGLKRQLEDPGVAGSPTDPYCREESMN